MFRFTSASQININLGSTDIDKDFTEAIFSESPLEMVDKFGFKLGTTNFKPGDARFGMRCTVRHLT